MSADEKPKGGTLKSPNGSFDRAAKINPDNARADSVEGAAKMRPRQIALDSVNGAFRMKAAGQSSQATKGVVQKAAPTPAPSKPVGKK